MLNLTLRTQVPRKAGAKLLLFYETTKFFSLFLLSKGKKSKDKAQIDVEIGFFGFVGVAYRCAKRTKHRIIIV